MDILNVAQPFSEDKVLILPFMINIIYCIIYVILIIRRVSFHFYMQEFEYRSEKRFKMFAYQLFNVI